MYLATASVWEWSHDREECPLLYPGLWTQQAHPGHPQLQSKPTIFTWFKGQLQSHLKLYPIPGSVFQHKYALCMYGFKPQKDNKQELTCTTPSGVATVWQCGSCHTNLPNIKLITYLLKVSPLLKKNHPLLTRFFWPFTCGLALELNMSHQSKLSSVYPSSTNSSSSSSEIGTDTSTPTTSSNSRISTSAGSQSKAQFPSWVSSQPSWPCWCNRTPTFSYLRI